MFLLASAHRGRGSLFGGLPDREPPTDRDPPDRDPLDRDPLDRDPLDRDHLDRDSLYGIERAVRILLECILVTKVIW